VYGGLDERMAEAVENAEVILVCMSSKYQTSENCRKEFEVHSLPILFDSTLLYSRSFSVIVSFSSFLAFLRLWYWVTFFCGSDKNNMKMMTSLRLDVDVYIYSTRLLVSE
jgi:hypothetical protein